MRIEIVDKRNIYIFLNSAYFNDIDLNSKEDIIFVVKDFIVKYKKKLNLRGFYKVKVYANSKVGLFLEIIRIDDIEISNNVDLRVIVHLDDKIYFKTEEYDILPKNSPIYYLDNNFYCDLDSIDNILNIVEFGQFIYGSKAIDMLDNSIVI